MISHVTVGVSDTERSKRFYDAVFAPIGLQLRVFAPDRVSWQRPEEAFPFFTALIPFDDQPPSPGNGAMVAFLAETHEAVDAAYAAAMAEGGICDGEPGPRPQYHDFYYGTYFRDPDGNKIHIVCHHEL